MVLPCSPTGRATTPVPRGILASGAAMGASWRCASYALFLLPLKGRDAVPCARVHTEMHSCHSFCACSPKTFMLGASGTCVWLFMDPLNPG